MLLQLFLLLQLVLAVEHNFTSTNELRQFLSSLNDTSEVVVNKSYHANNANATFIVLCRNDDLYTLLETIDNVQHRFNDQYNYDYTLLNDVPFDKDLIYLVSCLIPGGQINFGTIDSDHWGYPDFIDVNKARYIHSLASYPYGDSESYRHMCRFYSGFFYKHPLVAKYRYYWRFEPGVKLSCTIDYDVFKFMIENDKKFGFTISLFEYRETIPSLWDYYKKYIDMKKIDANNLPLIDMIQNDDIYQLYNLCHFWSNFEIGDLSIYDDKYDDFFNFLDSTGGFYYERWGDAPVHTLGVVLFLQKSDIHWFNDFGYFHQPYLQCPQQDDIYINRKCTCDPNEDFTDSMLSCTPHFLDVLRRN